MVGISLTEKKLVLLVSMDHLKETVLSCVGMGTNVFTQFHILTTGRRCFSFNTY